MRTPYHDDVVRLLAEHPRLVAEILSDGLGMDLPYGPVTRVEDLGIRVPDDVEAVLVIVLGAPEKRVVVVQVPQDESGDPRPLARFAAELWLRLGCDVMTLAVCVTSELARHHRRAIDTGLTGYWPRRATFGPLLCPEGGDTATPEMRRLEEAMTSAYWWIVGRLEVAIKTVLLVLQVRGLDVPAEVRDRISACTDLARAESWIARAATAETVQDVFVEERPA